MWSHMTHMLPTCLVVGEMDAEATKILTDIVFLEEKCKYGWALDLIEDYRKAATIRSIGDFKGSPVELYAGLVRANVHHLQHAPQRIFYAAFNSPSNIAPAIDARKLLSEPERRSYVWGNTQGGEGFLERSI